MPANPRMKGAAVGFIERRVRESWAGDPGPVSRLGSALYAIGAEVRGLLYEVGLIESLRSPIPIVSIGGLTIGGSGKTPIVADLARQLVRAGIPAAILTRGHADEIEVHRRLCPGARVYGDANRHGLAHRAALDGAGIAVLDSGFQHRRLRRDLDVVVLDDTSMRLATRRLPAGPYRDGLHALQRCDLIICVKRRTDAAESERACGFLERATVWRTGCPPILRARIRAGDLVPVNDLARQRPHPGPRLAVAGVMWPELFFAAVRESPGGHAVDTEIPLRDHAVFDARATDSLLQAAGEAGLVCSLKDAVKLAPVVGERVPVWFLDETVEWAPGDGARLLDSVVNLLDMDRETAPREYRWRPG